MSVDADLHLRWPAGLAPTTGELATLLGLRYGADGGPWGETPAPDGGSTMRVRISTDPADLLGPRPGRATEHRYDHWLVLTPARREPYPLDTYAVLRAHARETIALLRHHGLVEATFGIDASGADGYWTAARTLLGPEPADVDLTLWWGTETPTTPTPSTPTPPPGPDDITRALAARAAGLPTQHTTRYTGRQVTPDQLDAFADHLTATLTRPGEQLDLALWLGPHLLRHQTATHPTTDLRLLP
ncbi:hypothetical protein AB0F71_33235 [Kitasatospora sp. NPDC028055]|uniref:hypothetical protein n=1 Tax=Kitasatospora sp. NPDC028055 TaxID=3155653 RepID=UPI0033D237F1